MSSITSKPLKPSNVDVTNFKFSKVNTIPNGAKVIYLNNGDGINPLFIQSPEMNIPFDSGTYYPDNDNSGKYAIKVSMDNIETNQSMKDYHTMLNDMDNHLIKMGIENSSDWFKTQQWFKKKGTPEEKIADNYTRMVKVSLDSETGEPNGKWAPSFGFKIVKRNGVVLCDCYDSNKNKLETDGEGAVDLETMFKKGTKVKMILKCNGLWISNVGWGCTWRAEQIKIDVPVGFSGYAFDDDDDDGGLELTRQSTAVKEVKSNFVESDDESSVKDSTGSVNDSSDDSDGSDEEDNGEPTSVKRRVKK